MSNPIQRFWQPMTCAALMCGLVATPSSAAFPVPHKVGPGTKAHHNHTNHPTAPHPHMANHAMHHHTAIGVGNVNRVNGNGNGNNGNNANHSATITTLHQIHTLLIKADHDYAGHRAKAAEHVSHAIRELGGQHHHNNGTGKILGIRVPVNKNGNGNGNANKLPQAESDAHLRQALQKLSGLNGHVPNTHKAAQHVQAAITELNTALKVN